MNRHVWRLSAIGVFIALLLGLMMPAQPVMASVKGRRNTAIALSGAALYELVKGHGPAGLILAGGSYYAWQRVKTAKRHQRAQYRLHRVGYAVRSRHHVSRVHHRA